MKSGKVACPVKRCQALFLCADRAVSYTHLSLSYLGRVSYNYADKYLFQFLFRSDASTKFAPANYWSFFPGVSVGWVASEEEFMKKLLPSWFEYMKLRFSWGRTGKDNIKAWGWKQLYPLDPSRGYGFGSNGGILQTGIKPGATPNPDAQDVYKRQPLACYGKRTLLF